MQEATALFAPDEAGGLVRHAIDNGGSPAYWGVTAFYVAAAGFFSYLAFFNSGLKGSRR